MSAAPRNARVSWRRWLFIGLVMILLPMWSRGIWRERLTELEGREVTGRVIDGVWRTKYPRFTIEFPTRNGPYRKEFSVTRDNARRITGDSDEIVQFEVLIRFREEDPDAARLASEIPLPWWGSVLGILVVFTVLGFVMWPRPAKR